MNRIQNFKSVKLKRFLPKFLILVFMVGVFSCQKDDSFNGTDKPTATTQDNQVSIQTLTLEDLSQRQSLSEPLGKMEGLLDVDKASGAYSKLTATDNSFTVLTDEIVELTTSNSVSYSFRTETPINLEADFENLVLYQKEGEPYRFYLYSYKTIFYDGQWNNYIISRILIDGEALGLGSLVGDLALRTFWSGGCLWNISQSGNEIIITQLWCPDGSGTGDIGGGGGGIGVPGNGAQPLPNDSCSDWVLTGSFGGDKCSWHKGCVDAYGNEYYHFLPGPCNGEESGGTGTGTGDNGGSDAPPLDIDDGGLPTGGGGGGSGSGSDGGETVGVNPPAIPYDQQIIQCLGPQSDNDTATAIANWFNTASHFEIKAMANYLVGDNECSGDAQEAMTDFIKVKEKLPDAKLERYLDLIDLIEDNPWALVEDCAQQNGLDIANYQYLYEHTLPQECQTRLDALGNDFQDQPLNEGNAAVANVDYYGVEITQNPDFNNDGNPDSNAEVFQAYKENFANLASGGQENFQFSCDIPGNSTDTADVSWTFTPYFNSDLSLWLSSNPLTTIFLIDASADMLFGEAISDDGAIMISEFTSNYWIGSTITTTESEIQPFSGNRQWGYLTNMNGNLELYARAVDVARIADYIRLNPFSSEECEDDTYYNIGEATWSNLQEEIKQFIIANGGQAEVVPKTAIRFDKAKLKEVLESNESIDQIPCD